MTEVKDIDFHVRWSEEDEEWLATCNAFPSLSFLSESPERALAGLIITVDEVVTEELEARDAVHEALFGDVEVLGAAHDGRCSVDISDVLPPVHNHDEEECEAGTCDRCNEA